MAHEDEAEAFRDFLSVFPENSTLLVDTYDVRAAVEKIIALGRKPGGVRLDSGVVPPGLIEPPANPQAVRQHVAAVKAYAAGLAGSQAARSGRVARRADFRVGRARR